MSTNRIEATFAVAGDKAAFLGRLGEFLGKAKKLSAGGFTLAELGYLFLQLLHLAIGEAAKLESLDGAGKKTLVLEAIGQLFDLVSPAIPLPAWLAWARTWFLPSLRLVVLGLADGMVEVLWLKRDAQSGQGSEVRVQEEPAADAPAP